MLYIREVGCTFDPYVDSVYGGFFRKTHVRLLVSKMDTHIAMYSDPA